MEVKEIENKKKWDDFLTSQDRSQFLLSYNWGEFKKSLGLKIWRLAVLKKEEIVGACLIVKSPLVFKNNYLYATRGPVFNFALNSKELSQGYDVLIKEIKKIAAEENSVFLKIEPPLEKPFTLNFEKINFQPAKSIQPPDTVILNLRKSEDELLSCMHQKTRYNIRLAERKGVEVSLSEDIKDIDLFYDLVQVVNKREKINSFSKNYYQKMFEIFARDRMVKIARAEYKGKVIVANLIIYFGDMVTYNHGASSEEYRNVMAPHLVQWKTIIEAKKLGYKYYDFRGIAPDDSPKHKWAGITRFKKGFSKETVHYLGAFDLVFKPFFYQLYLLGKRIK